MVAHRIDDEADRDDNADAFDPPDEEDDEEPTVGCPYCGWQVPEDVVRCPYCENYLSAEAANPARKPLWIIIGTVVCLYVIYRWIAG